MLLDTALALFAEAGYRAVSVGEIAAAAGVTKPVIYEHFGSKADLCVALFEREVQALSVALLESFDPSAKLPQRLHALAGEAVRYARRKPTSIRLLLQEPLGEARVAAAHQASRAAARNAIAAAILLDPLFDASPALSRQASAELHADMQVALLERLIRWALEHPRTSAKALADFFVELLWHGPRSSGL